MPKIKVVPVEEEREYVKLTTQLEVLQAKHKVAKLKMLKYYEKGYEFSFIRPSDTSGGVVSIPWKQICIELMTRFMSKPVRLKYLSSLAKRFPKTERTPVLNILGKKAKAPVHA